jgi:hypothetical protein
MINIFFFFMNNSDLIEKQLRSTYLGAYAKAYASDKAPSKRSYML